MTSGLAITLFVVGVVASIMVHEWGHFWTARRFGMRADRFFLGFGPTLWSTHRGETEYGVKLLPLGGFVRIKGMSPTDERLRPVPDVVLDPETLAGDRRALAEDTGRDLQTVTAIPDAAFARLDRELDQRGTPAELRQRLVHRFRTNLAADATPAEARQLLVELICSETTETGRVGDLRHRLLRGDEGRFFPDRPAWQRAIVLAAGSTLHMVQAALLLFLGFLLFGQQVATPTVGEFTEGSAAQAAGLEVGDRLVSVGERPVAEFEDIRQSVRRNPGEPLQLTVERDGEQFVYTVTPESTQDPETGERIGLIGVVPGVEDKALPADEALYETFVGEGSVTRMTTETVKALGRVFGPEGIGALFNAIAGDAERTQDGGISLVGAASAAGSGTAAFGPLFLFFLLASVNVFVGVFNILPLPPLDGGHLAVLGIERSVNAVRAARGQSADFSIDPRAVAAVALPVIVLVGTVSLGFLWLDITNPIQIGP